MVSNIVIDSDKILKTAICHQTNRCSLILTHLHADSTFKKKTFAV
jgi:hypothetical protein